jgi:hypothetical protein
MMTSTLLGSESWTNEPRYQNAYRARLDFVLGKVSVLTLQKLGSLLRNGLECTVSNNFSAGDFNLVKKITFEDEVRWIVRIRLPPISYFSFGIPKDKAHDRRVEGENSSIKCTERDLESLRSEIVTMKYLRFDVPFPAHRS